MESSAPIEFLLIALIIAFLIGVGLYYCFG